jgi:glycosyltransferase involved in cell wall biosynthesis
MGKHSHAARLMRILTVSALMDAESGGGNAERVLQLSKAFARAGAMATVLTLDIGLTAARRATFEHVKLVALRCLQRRFLVPALSKRSIERVIADADVIHLTNHWTMLNAIVARIATRMGIPYVVCPAGALPVFGRSKFLKAGYNAVTGRRLVREANGWVAITDDERLQFLPYAVDPSDVIVIPNGIWIEEFAAAHDKIDFRNQFGIGGGVTILFVGRLNPIKGPDMLLEAFARVHRKDGNAHLLYVGPDEGMREQLIRRADGLGLSGHVHFMGYLAGTEKLAAYRAADIIAVPSRSEAMSLVALEAGACGKPVILTDRCGFGEAASAGGGLVVTADPDALSGAILKLLGDANLRTRMGANLKRLVESRYTWPNSAQQYLELFTSVKRGLH